MFFTHLLQTDRKEEAAAVKTGEGFATRMALLVEKSDVAKRLSTMHCWHTQTHTLSPIYRLPQTHRQLNSWWVGSWSTVSIWCSKIVPTKLFTLHCSAHTWPLILYKFWIVIATASGWLQHIQYLSLQRIWDLSVWWQQCNMQCTSQLNGQNLYRRQQQVGHMQQARWEFCTGQER